jgi:hypothetical protein
MAVESDDDRAAFSDGFGESVTWVHGQAGTPVAGIFSAPAAVFDVGASAGLVMARPTFLCPAGAVPGGADEGDAIGRDVGWWLVRTLLPDGTGMVRARLERTTEVFYGASLDFSDETNSQYLGLV